jgi:hypothetical protein
LIFFCAREIRVIVIQISLSNNWDLIFHTHQLIVVFFCIYCSISLLSLFFVHCFSFLLSKYWFFIHLICIVVRMAGLKFFFFLVFLNFYLCSRLLFKCNWLVVNKVGWIYWAARWRSVLCTHIHSALVRLCKRADKINIDGQNWEKQKTSDPVLSHSARTNKRCDIFIRKSVLMNGFTSLEALLLLGKVVIIATIYTHVPKTVVATVRRSSANHVRFKVQNCWHVFIFFFRLSANYNEKIYDLLALKLVFHSNILIPFRDFWLESVIVLIFFLIIDKVQSLTPFQ